MNSSLLRPLLVPAFCITGTLCAGQSDPPHTYHFSELKNDSLLAYVESLEINCSSDDAKTYLQKKDLLVSLQQLIFKGDTDGGTWGSLLKTIRLKPGLRDVTFSDDSLTVLPYGYESLGALPQLTFRNNDMIDYNGLLDQLQTLPDLSTLSLDIITVFDLPGSFTTLKNLQELVLTNTDEHISKNDTSGFIVPKAPLTYNLYIDKGKGAYAAVRYISMAGEIDGDEYRELTKRFKTPSDTGTETTGTAFVPKYRYVKPPLQGIDVERTQYTLNPKTDNVIVYPTGTAIRIPANAFRDMKGKAVTTPVTLSYREFRDPVDFLASGIPMKYDTAGGIENFESAGMFELTASLKDEPLQLAQGKKIDMNFASTSKDSTYNFYAFNDSTGNWQYLGKPQPVSASTRIIVPATTRAYRLYRQLTAANTMLYDSASLEQRFNSREHIYTSSRDTSISKRFVFKKDGRKRTRDMSMLVRISNVKRTKEGDVLFRIGYMKEAHPEMSAFDNTYFASGENMDAAAFREKYQRKKRYSDIRIYPNGSSVEVVLKDARSMYRIPASLVTLDKKGKVSGAKDAGSRIKRYQRRLQSRARSFDRQVAKGKMENNSVRITDPEIKSQHAYMQVKNAMNDTESAMSYEEWKAYCAQTEANEAALKKLNDSERQKIVSAKGATADNLVESLQLDGFGIYNCDQIQRMKEPVKIFAGYRAADKDRALNIASAYVIDRHCNSVYQYDGYMGYSADKIAFSRSPEAENTLLAIDPKGEVSIYTTADFAGKEFKNKSHFDFVVTKINSNFTTVSDLKKIIGF